MGTKAIKNMAAGEAYENNGQKKNQVDIGYIGSDCVYGDFRGKY